MKKLIISIVIVAAIVGAVVVIRAEHNRKPNPNIILNTTGHAGEVVATNGNTVVRLNRIVNRNTNATTQAGQTPQ